MILRRSIFGSRLLDRVADHAYCHNYPRPRNSGTCDVGQVIRATLLIREVDEARLCGSSLPTGPMALPALGRSRPALNKKSRTTGMGFEPRPSDPQSEALTS